MGYNKKILSQATAGLNKAKAPAKPKDIIMDPRGQWEHPGQPTRIPGNNITMQGVPYPVYGIDNTGFAQMMYPGQDYQFQGEYVDEYPMLKKGGEKKYSRSITATNKLFKKNPLVKKKKTKNKKTFDPNAKYYQDGGSSSAPKIDNTVLQKAISQVASKNSVGINGIPDTNITSFNQIYPEIVNAVKERYDELIKESLALNQYGGDISIPELTKAQEGGQKDQWGRSLNDKWYGFDPQTKKYTIAPYKIEELRRQASGVSKYNPLQQKAIPSETTQQAPKNLPSQKKSMNEAMALKAAERDATINAVKGLPLITEDQRNEILMDPRKLDEYSYLTRISDPGTITQKKEQSWGDRLRDYALNPDAAIYYAMSGNDMPNNYQDMIEAGIDPMAGERGGNTVLKALNTVNPLVALNDVQRATSQGNYGEAGIGLLGFIPGFKQARALKKGLDVADSVGDIKRTSNILSDYRNIEELRLANKMKNYDQASQNFSELYPNKEAFDQIKKEATALLKKYEPEFTKQFGKGTNEEILLYGAHKDLENLPTNKNFLADDEFAKSAGLNNNLTNQQKFLGDAYQLEFSGYFNKNPQIGGNKLFANYLSDQFEPVITSNKLNRPVQVKRTSNFSRPVKTIRGDEELMLNYDDLREGDVIYPEHNWSTTSDVQGDVWGSGKSTSKVARINLPEGQSTFRPNMYKGTQYGAEEELVLPSKLGYKVSGINTQGFGDENPRFIFDVINPYKKGGYIKTKLTKAQEGISTGQCPPGYAPLPNGQCAPIDKTVDYEEVAVYKPEVKEVQLKLIDQLAQAKKAYQDWREEAGLRKARLRNEGASSIEGLSRQIEAYKKELAEEKKAYTKAQAALKSLQKHRPDEWKNAKLKDVLSPKGIEALRSLYSENKISDQTFRDFYNNFGSEYDPNVAKGKGPDRAYSAKEAEKDWMYDAPGFANMVNKFAMAAPLVGGLGALGPSLVETYGTLQASPFMQALGSAYKAPIAGIPGATAANLVKSAFLGETLSRIGDPIKSLKKAYSGEIDASQAALDVTEYATELAMMSLPMMSIRNAATDLVKVADAPISKLIAPAGQWLQKNVPLTGKITSELEKIGELAPTITPIKLPNKIKPFVPSLNVPSLKDLSTADILRTETVLSTLKNAPENYTAVQKNIDLAIDPNASSADRLRALASAGNTSAANLLSMTPLFRKTAPLYNSRLAHGLFLANNAIADDWRHSKTPLNISRLLTRQEGGSTSYVTELSNKEIKELERQGYKVEYLD